MIVKLQDMTAKIINGVIRNGEIIPHEPLPKHPKRINIKIYVFPPTHLIQKRVKYKGSLPLGWGDPVTYQKRQRKGLDRN